MPLLRTHRSLFMLIGVLVFVPEQTGRIELPPVRSAAPHRPEQRRLVDGYGDSLPSGCIARLGTTRLKHGGSVACVAFAPDGKTLASGGDDHYVRIHETSTGKTLHRLPTAETWTHSIAFAPDGKVLAAVVGFRGYFAVQTWETKTGRELTRTGRIPCETPVLSPDLRFVAGQKERGTVGLWDAATGKLVLELEGYDGADFRIAFAADGRTLAVSSRGVVPHDAPRAKLHAWRLPDGKLLFRRLDEDGYFGPVALDPKGETLVWAPSEGPIRVRNLLSGQETAIGNALPGQHTTALRFTPDGRTLVASLFFDKRPGVGRTGEDAVFQFWDVRTGKSSRRLKCPCKKVRHLAVSPDGGALAVACGDRTVRLWDLVKGKELLQGHRLAVRAVRFSPDGTVIATGGEDASIRLWAADSGKEIGLLEGHRAAVRSIAFSPCGSKLASGSYDNTARVWDLRISKEIHRLHGGRDGGQERRINCVRFAPDGKSLAVGIWSSGTHLQDLHTWAPRWAVQGGSADTRRIDFSPDGKVLAFLNGLSQDAKTIHLVDAATGKPIRRITADPYIVTDLAFSPDGRLLATASGYEDAGFRVAESEFGAIQVWDATTGEQRVRLQKGFVGNNINALAFSPDGRILALGSNDGTVRLLELATGQFRARFVGSREEVWSLAFSPNGKLLASASNDGTVLVWDLHGSSPRTGQGLNGGMEALWSALAEQNAADAGEAINRLVADPGQTVPFLGARLHPASNARQVARLRTDLGSQHFRVREEATRELEALGPAVNPAIRAALVDCSDLEVRLRLVRLLKRSQGCITDPKLLRALRAIEVLERIGSPDAQRLLVDLARGAPGATATQEAKSALQRSRRRFGTDTNRFTPPREAPVCSTRDS
jgi:WD40 repeat protein